MGGNKKRFKEAAYVEKNLAGKQKNPFPRGKLNKSLILNTKMSPKIREIIKNPNKRREDQLRVKFEHNAKVKELVSAKKIFEPDNPKPFKVSRSKIENFIRCKALGMKEAVRDL